MEGFLLLARRAHGSSVREARKSGSVSEKRGSAVRGARDAWRGSGAHGTCLDVRYAERVGGAERGECVCEMHGSLERCTLVRCRGYGTRYRYTVESFPQALGRVRVATNSANIGKNWR